MLRKENRELFRRRPANQDEVVVGRILAAARAFQSRMPHCGLSVFDRAACVKTWSPGSRLTRPAPPRMALTCAAERPLRLLRIEPASLRASASTNLRGGAKSRAVKVLDLRRR